ncbi:hypothetical protein GJ744_001828 [Endocarpon pusillum]|uniref:Uncharacterized protein n=1 Tax=Endocarpon pusillum TaxID=364733 RepID=A0A8H7E8E6_9EURO|nr:hypothetical protein GJ744_001828 [Endocarpon pusillum]
MEEFSAVHGNLHSVACSDVRVTSRSLSRSSSRSDSTKQGKTQKTHNRLDRKLHPLLNRFLSSFNAKEAISPQSGYYTFILQPGTYEKTLKSLRQSDFEVWGYVEDKLRSDLIDDKILVIRMPTGIHESMVEKISHSIKSQLTVIATKTSNEDTKQLIRDIRAALSATIKVYGPNTFVSPDQQFFVKGLRFPGVVIEIAHTQVFKKLRRKARKLITRSLGKVHLVIGLETGRKSFKISAWCPEFHQIENQDALRMKTMVDQDIIRDSDGTLKPGSFRFYLRDFGTDLATKYPNADLTEEIVLSYNDLAEYLIDAEEDDIPSSPDTGKGKGIILEDSCSSAGDEFTSEDEGKFLEFERRSAARSEALDPDYP